MTNKEEILQAIEELNETDLAILRERILTVTQYVVDNKGPIKEQIEKDGMIDANIFIESCERIFNVFNFKNQPE